MLGREGWMVRRGSVRRWVSGQAMRRRQPRLFRCGEGQAVQFTLTFPLTVFSFYQVQVWLQISLQIRIMGRKRPGLGQRSTRCRPQRHAMIWKDMGQHLRATIT